MGCELRWTQPPQCGIRRPWMLSALSFGTPVRATHRQVSRVVRGRLLGFRRPRCVRQGECVKIVR